MKQILTVFFLLGTIISYSQLDENFSDGDFTTNPTWLGDDSVFTVLDVTGDFKLRSNKLIASSSFYLSTVNSLVINTQWEFTTKLAFSTSSTNYVDVFLTADQSNLLAVNLNGYFVRVGGTTDEISLFKKINGSDTKIIDGIDGIVASASNNNFRIKVICSAVNDWSLERDGSGTGNTYFLEGNVTDNSLTTSGFFGMKVTQSSASFFQKHFLDDIYVGAIIIDQTPPSIVSATIIDANNVDLLFSENVSQASVENIDNYDIIPFNGISLAVRDVSNLSLVHLTTSTALSNGSTYNLTVQNIDDLNANTLSSESINFSYLIAEIPVKGDLLISEFFVDPTPKIGLPEIEFVELYNKSNKIFQLQGWKLGDNATSGTLLDGWILPGEYKVLCPTSAIDSFPNSIGVTSFPSLNNSGDNIVIRYPDVAGAVIIDSLTYLDTWYKDAIKKNGGYTIERINQNDPCSDIDNWIASISTSGGTPGLVNSVNDNSPDTQGPTITSLIASAPNFLTINFSESMNALSIANSIEVISPLLTISNTFISGDNPNSYTLQFNQNILGSQIYSISIPGVADCWNNVSNLNEIFALPEEALAGDLIINEILSDPITGGYDFIEIKNNSNKLINLKDYQLANIAGDTIANKKDIIVNFIMNAGDYAVITSDSNSQKSIYPATIPGRFIQMSLPTYSNDSGSVILLRIGQIVDMVSYKKDWQFSLLDSPDGKSLERIDPFGKSNDINNWHTASETIGFATPGGKNSQIMYGENDGVVSLTKSIFSPDNDGFEDVLQINYSMIDLGKVATLTVYDDKGRLVKTITRSELIGNEGTFTWNGVNDSNTKASIGQYILFFEAFDINGGVFMKKLPFVLAGQL